MSTSHRPMMSAANAARLQAWHQRASQRLHELGAHEVDYLGLALTIPDQVFPPTPVSDLLGRAVLDGVRVGDRVLDMGTGSGANALLAARTSDRVIGVDVNPHAVAAARANAARNALTDRTVFAESDLFAHVTGTFDLIIFDPPFRWFAPRDRLEQAITDEDYRTLTRFVAEAESHLTPDGRVLLFFGTSGDIAYLHTLLDRCALVVQTIAERTIAADGDDVSYYVYRLTRSRS